jgi:predicted nucleic acid-binding protein
MTAQLIPKNVIISDTTVLINFINSGHFDLLLKVFNANLHITDIVREEVITGRIVLEEAIKKKEIFVHPTDLTTLAKVVNNFSSFDPGEASCLILAEKESWRVATDDGAAKSYISKTLGHFYIITTFDILTDAVNFGYISKANAFSIVEEMRSKANFLYSDTTYKSFKDSLK